MGVGEWTVEMILMFRLGRKDVFSVKDLGLLNAIYKLYKINPKKYNPKNLKKKVLKISQAWAPHRTLACRYLWDYKDKK
jgi:DNA-3-methyladenine glycosylase II